MWHSLFSNDLCYDHFSLHSSSHMRVCCAMRFMAAGEQEGTGDLWQHHQGHHQLTTAAVK
jgi:hypothetical protein